MFTTGFLTLQHHVQLSYQANQPACCMKCAWQHRGLQGYTG